MNPSKPNTDRLFLLNPDFTDNRLEPADQHYYCPFNAMLEGVLKYFPQLRDQLDITYVDFPRPRKVVIEEVGEENQGLPILVIERTDIDLASINTKSFNSKTFIHGSDNIAKYLAVAYGIPLPHP